MLLAPRSLWASLSPLIYRHWEQNLPSSRPLFHLSRPERSTPTSFASWVYSTRLGIQPRKGSAWRGRVGRHHPHDPNAPALVTCYVFLPSTNPLECWCKPTPLFQDLRTEGFNPVFDKPAAAAAKSCQSCLTLWDPREGSPPGSSVPGILQARTLEWVAISFSNAHMHAC